MAYSVRGTGNGVRVGTDYTRNIGAGHKVKPKPKPAPVPLPAPAPKPVAPVSAPGMTPVPAPPTPPSMMGEQAGATPASLDAINGQTSGPLRRDLGWRQPPSLASLLQGLRY